jgi:hypothetical protein
MADVERSGRHAGPRHAAQPTDQPTEPVRLDASLLPPVSTPHASARGGGGRLPLLLLALGITAAVVAWGYLVYLAIDFGTAARDGDNTGWWMLGLATVGAIACLFLAMMLGARLFQRLRADAAPPPPPRTPGGRRAAR